MNIKDRILQYLDYKGLSVTKAEQELGWSKSSLLKSNNVSGDKISEFVLHYSDLSPEWLLTGEGDMLKNVNQTVGNISNSRVSGVNVNGKDIHINPDAYETLLKIVDTNQRTVEKFQDQLDRLLNILESRI